MLQQSAAMESVRPHATRTCIRNQRRASHRDRQSRGMAALDDTTERLWHRRGPPGPCKRRASVHSSFCWASTAPTSRMMASRVGQMPTTSVRLRISLFNRSRGFIAPHLAPDLAGEGGEGQDVVAGLLQVLCSGRELRRQRRHDLGVLGADGGASGCSKIALARRETCWGRICRRSRVPGRIATPIQVVRRTVRRGMMLICWVLLEPPSIAAKSSEAAMRPVSANGWWTLVRSSASARSESS
jgi:hypothetical protein